MKETSTMPAPSLSGEPAILDDRIRGFPAGHAPVPLDEIGQQGWKPFDGSMSLPLISLDEAAFAANAEAMMAYVRSHGCGIAPHAKTPMSPALAQRLLQAGAWGTTVADIRQASVMLKAGMTRLILANEIGGVAAARRLAALLAGYPQAEVHIFVDSIDLAEALSTAWREREGLPVLGLLPELGAARGGSRSAEAALDIAEHILSRETERFKLTGIGGYEGAAATADPAETRSRIENLMGEMADLHRGLRKRVGAERELLVTAGGSVYFDLVAAALGPIVADDPQSKLVLRSGAIFFHDHGVYERGLSALDGRQGFEISGKVMPAASTFKPGLRVWAEVLSRPEPGLAICGMGLRDVAMDQGLPRPLALYRDGREIADLTEAKVTKLNDQHAFVELGDSSDVRIGDVVEFGISHPCTCLDRHGILYGLDPEHRVVAAYATYFG
jgi:D-serine dehydratase